MPTVKELRNQLGGLGLSTRGRKAALEQRLLAAQEKSATPDSPTTPDDNTDALVAVRIEIGDPAVMIEDAGEAVRSVKKDELEHTIVAGHPTVANTRAVRYIESHFNRENFESRLKATESRLKTIESRLKTIENELRSEKSFTSDLQNRIACLEESVSDLKDVRNRFISTVKRDILLNDTETDRVIIRTGNRFVHGGDCKRDADLYEPPAKRRDFDIYIKLYGLHPGIVRSSIFYRPTIELLDRHATAVADTTIKLSKKFNDLFLDYIRALEMSNYEEDYLSKPTSSVTVAYWAFHQSCPE